MDAAMIEPEPYAVQIKDFDAAKHEWYDARSEHWTTRTPYHFWLIVRDKVVEPEPVSLAERLRQLDSDEIGAFQDIAEALVAEGYAAEYPEVADLKRQVQELTDALEPFQELRKQLASEAIAAWNADLDANERPPEDE